MNIIVGSHVWVEDPAEAWIDGEVFRINGEEVHVHTTSGKTVCCNELVCDVYSITCDDIFLSISKVQCAKKKKNY